MSRKKKIVLGVLVIAVMGFVAYLNVGMRKAIVVLVESVIEPEPPVEHERADERAGPIAGLLEDSRQRRHIGAQARRAVGVDTVMERQAAGQDRRVSRQGHRHVRIGASEPDAVGGGLVDDRGQIEGAAIRAKPIAPQRVDRDEQDVRAGARLGLQRRRWRRRPRAAAEEEAECGDPGTGTRRSSRTLAVFAHCRQRT